MSGTVALLLRGHEGSVLGEVERDLAVARPDRSAAGPDHGPGREERVEVALVVAGDPRRQDP